MRTVGIRELKQNLSHYLRKIKSGESIVVTDRKKEVAILMPFEREAEEEKILRLVKGGIAYWSGAKPIGLEFRIRSRGRSVSDAVLEDRR